MHMTSGNNAYKTVYDDAPGHDDAQARPRRPAGIPFDADVRRQLARHEVKVHRHHSRNRIARFLMYLAAISFVALVFTGILLRQAQIMEMNYQNVRLERDISRLRTETESIKEEFVKSVDPAVIRRIAVEELGMREPATAQIVYVTIPAGDKVVVDFSDDIGDLDADLEGMFDNVEGFFKTMR